MLASACTNLYGDSIGNRDTILETSHITIHHTSDVQEEDVIRQHSRAMFGNRYRLEAAAYMAGRKAVTARELERELGIKHNVAMGLLRYFRRHGLMETVEPAHMNGRRVYLVHNHPTWDACAVYLRAITASECA